MVRVPRVSWFDSLDLRAGDEIESVDGAAPEPGALRAAVRGLVVRHGADPSASPVVRRLRPAGQQPDQHADGGAAEHEPLEQGGVPWQTREKLGGG